MPAPDRHARNNPEAPLLAVIRRLIRDRGPIPVAEYMRLALGHPEFGYYQTRDPFGAAGDFVTAPEISQVFGELLGLWLATAWRESGRAGRFRLVELGPGRGQLMADLIRATDKIPGFLANADIHLVESSQRLRAVQRRALPDIAVTWHDRFETVPPGPILLIANEFVDALPVHQLRRTGTGWGERLVDRGDRRGLVFTEGEAPPGLIAMVPGADQAEAGTVAEVSPARSALATAIGRRLSDHGGVALIIDYGAWVRRPTGDTLQAVRAHRSVDPLELPGEADLTTQVDFRSFAEAAVAGGAAVFGPVPQGAFLRVLGIEPRIAALLRGADARQRESLRGALFRLTDAGAMGELFKAMALASPADPSPPGFQVATLRPKTRSR